MPPIRPALRGLAVAIVLTTLAACEVPTEAPKWDTEWELPVDSMRLSVDEFLPSTIEVTPDRQSFALQVDPIDFTRTLGEMCAPCAAADGQSAPKPAFGFTFSDQITLAQDVVSATLAQGALTVTLSHDFSFDPLQPSGAETTGSVTATLLHDGAVLGTTTISGETTAFPAGTTLTRTIALAPTVLTGAIVVEITLDSPESPEPVQIDTSDRITVAATPSVLQVTEAEVSVQDVSVSVEPMALDLEGVDAFVIDRVKGGALIMEIANPFQLQGALSLILDTPSDRITKSVSFQPGTAGQRVELSADEFRQILGSPVVLSATGSVTSAGATVTVTPAQELVMRSRIELILGPKEEEG